MAVRYSATYEKHLNCSICMEVFTEPRALPCLHTFCLGCLQSFISSQARKHGAGLGFECPVCRTVVTPPMTRFNVDTWASDFPPNYAVKSLLEESLTPGEGQAEASRGNEDRDDIPSSTTDDHDMCDDHPDRRVEFFCEDHHVLCCSVCAALRHRRCENVRYLYDDHEDDGGDVCPIDGKQMDMAGVEGSARFLTEQQILSEGQRKLQRVHRPLSRSIQSSTEDMNIDLPSDLISPDQTERSMSPSSAASRDGSRGSHKALRRLCGRSHMSLSISLDETDGTNRESNARGSESRSVDYTHVQKRRTSSSGSVSDSPDSSQTLDTGRRAVRLGNLQQVRRNSADSENTERPVCDSATDSINGAQERTPEDRGVRSRDRPRNLYRQVKTDSTESDSPDGSDVRRQRAVDKSIHEVTLSPVGEFEVCQDSDDVSNITGMACFPNGELLLADNSNKKLKRVGSDHRCYCELNLQSAPWDVDTIGDFEAVVSLPDEMRLQILLLDETMVAKGRVIQFDKKCYGVRYGRQELFVSLGQEIRIVSYRGETLKKINKSRFFGNKRSLFSNVPYLAVDCSRDIFYVSENGKGSVMSVDRNGSILDSCTSGHKGRPLGITMGPSGYLFVCHSPSDLVLVKFGQQGSSEKTILSLKDIVGVHFSPETCRLYISRSACNAILVYDVGPRTNA